MDAFDKHMKSVFEDHEIEVDTDLLWQKVEPALKRKRFPFAILFLFVFGAMLIGSFLYIDKTEGKETPGLASSSQVYNQSVFGRSGQLKNNVSGTKQKMPEGENNTSRTVQSKTEVDQKIDNKKINKPLNKQKIFPNDLVKVNDKKAESIVNTIQLSDPVEEPRALYSTKKVATNTVIQPVIPLFYALTTIRTKPIVHNRNFKYSLDVFGGTGLLKKQLVAKSFDNKWYENDRHNTEHFLETFDVGAQFQMKHNSGFIAGTGINYRQIDELFQSESSAQIRLFKEGIVEIVTNADGSLTEITGQKLVINRISWNKKKYNNYSFISVPVYAGYSFSSDLMHFEITSGIDINLIFLKEGEIIGNEGFPVSVSESQNSIFRKNTSVNLIGGFKLLYPLTDRMTIYSEPNFYYNLYSITDADHPLEQRYIHAGIRFGTRFVF